MEKIYGFKDNGSRIETITKDEFSEEIDEVNTSIAGLEEKDTLMEERITELENDSSGGEIYSTEEIVVGTWIDGKPLYRRFINFGLLGNTTVNVEFTLTVENMNVIKYSCYLQQHEYKGTTMLPINNGTHFCYPQIYTTNQNKLIAYIYRDVEASWRDHYLCAIITYTKMND